MKILLLVTTLFLLGCAGESASVSSNLKKPAAGESGQPLEPGQCRYEVDNSRCQTDGSLCVNECGQKIVTLNCFEMSGRIVGWSLTRPNELVDMPIEWCDNLNGLRNPMSIWYRTQNGEL